MHSLSQRLTNRELLQRGDLTLCYRARDAVLDRPVFVKVLNPALAKDAEIRARFEREAKAVARLDHPNLVRIYEYGEDPQEGIYMLLEWVDGTTLAKQIAEGMRFTGENFMQLARELLSGLAALHGVGILHRDLKPENVLVTPPIPPAKAGGERYKITDFSLAALRDAPKLTHHEAIVGTPAYMAPEQASGGKPTEQSDLFSLGVILYEAATGKNPLIGETMLDTLRKIRESNVSFTHSAIINLPPQGRSLLEKLVRKNPGERPTSAHDALSFLNGNSEPAELHRTRSKYRSFRFALMGAVVLAVGILLIRSAGKPKNGAASFSTPDTTLAIRPPVKMMSDSDSIPEFHNPSLSTAETTRSQQAVPIQKNGNVARNTPQIVPPDTTAANPDSVDVTINTEPWAHIFFKGRQIGTTPLTAPLHLPRGEHLLVLRNPAFPAIDLPIRANESSELSVRLAQYVTRIGARVEPWGEVYVDGEHIGTTPFTRLVYVSPGHHTIRISHPNLGSLQREIDAAAGQVLDLEANLKAGTFFVMMDLEKRP